MSKKKSNSKSKKIRESNGNNCFHQLDSVNSSTKEADSQQYFLGFKRKNFNALWHWKTLEDVKF